MEVRTNTLTPELFLELYTSVGWEPPCIEQVQEALRHTIATFTAYHNHEAVRDGQADWRRRDVLLHQGLCSTPITSGQGCRAIADGTFGKLHQKQHPFGMGGQLGAHQHERSGFVLSKNGI